MISLGMNTIYTISDELCQMILGKIDRIKDHPKLHESHFLERLRYLFIRHCDDSIIDDEFARLKNDKAIAYYKMFFENRKQSLKENVAREVAYFQRRVAEGDSLMYIGESYGEQAYAVTGREAYHNVYIDLSRKNSRQLANIAIVKQKMEEDFVSFKLRMFFQLIVYVAEHGQIPREEHLAENRFPQYDPACCRSCRKEIGSAKILNICKKFASHEKLYFCVGRIFMFRDKMLEMIGLLAIQL